MSLFHPFLSLLVFFFFSSLSCSRHFDVKIYSVGFDFDVFFFLFLVCSLSLRCRPCLVACLSLLLFFAVLFPLHRSQGFFSWVELRCFSFYYVGSSPLPSWSVLSVFVFVFNLYFFAVLFSFLQSQEIFSWDWVRRFLCCLELSSSSSAHSSLILLLILLLFIIFISLPRLLLDSVVER